MLEDEGSVAVVPKDVYEFPKLEDIVGKPREFLDEVISNVHGDKIFKAMGVNPDRSFLLYGPPGTGKTLSLNVLNNHLNQGLMKKMKELEKNVAVKIKVSDYGFLMFSYDIGKLGTAYINRGALKVQRFFGEVRAYAQNTKATGIEIDECDALFMSRRDSHSEDRKVLETLMKNLQQIHDDGNIYTFLMTNLPDICDDASFRAGRIDRKIKFDLPTKAMIELAIHAQVEQINNKAGYQVIRNYDAKVLSEQMLGFNYADVNSIITKAVKQRAYEISQDRAKGIIPAGYVTQNRLEKAVLEHKGSFKDVGKRGIGF